MILVGLGEARESIFRANCLAALPIDLLLREGVGSCVGTKPIVEVPVVAVVAFGTLVVGFVTLNLSHEDLELTDKTSRLSNRRFNCRALKLFVFL